MTETTLPGPNREGRAVLAAIEGAGPGAPTACSQWRAHELVAHLAAGATELAELVEAKLDGRPSRPTRPFDEREAPMRALPHEVLLERLIEASRRKNRAYHELAGAADPTIEFTAATVTADLLVTHARSEAAIHRWDLVGDDELSVDLLSQPALTAHAVRVLDAMPVLHESARALGARATAAGCGSATVAFRAPEGPDVVLHLHGGASRFELVDEAAAPDLVLATRADHRLLLLWGRRPAQLALRVEGDDRLAAALPSVVWPAAIPWEGWARSTGS